jgi:cytidylate kinase
VSLAQRLGWHLLDSGALYRVVAHAGLQRRIGLDDGDALAAMVAGLAIEFSPGEDGVTVIVDGQDVSTDIRDETVSAAASKVAAIPRVRTALLTLQHSFAKAPGLVADGRDMGTVVFQDAVLKFYLDASPEVRAERRYNQLKDKGLGVSLRRLLASIKERDERDTARAASPLKPAPDAVVIDSSTLSASEVLEHVWGLVQASGIS